VEYNFGNSAIPPGYYSNLNGGYGNITQIEYDIANTEWIPQRQVLENTAMGDWVNCPYMTYDYNDHYSEIAVPILAFESANFANVSGTFHFINGTASNDFTGVLLQNYGHLDVFFGTNSARDVSQPALNWMISHTPIVQPTPIPQTGPLSASAFTSVTILKGETWYFVVQAIGGAAPYKFQWYEGNTAITGATDMVLAISKTTSGTYTYTCQVTDLKGNTVTTNAVTLTVL